MIALGILAEDEVFAIEENMAPWRELYEIHNFSDWQSYDAPTLLAKCRSVEVILIARKSPRLPPELARDLGRLRYVCHLHGTIRPYVDKPLVEAGLIVTNWGDAQFGVAEGAMALLLCQLKQIPALNAFAKGGPDTRLCQMFPATLQGRDVGIYGFGPIGRQMARLLESFGARVAIHDPYAQDLPPAARRCDTLRELFATCQIISIHCGLNDATRDSVTGEFLALLPQGGILINTARGEIVDEAAVAQEVAAGRLLAALDVVRNEGDYASSPLAPQASALLTRHNISSGKGYPPGQKPPPKLPPFVQHNLRAYAAGEPLLNIIPASIYDLKT